MSNISLAVRHYMSNRLANLRENQDITEVVTIFTERNLFGGVVVDNLGNLIGILSVTDCIDAALRAGNHSGWRGTVGERMSRDIRTVDAEDNILDVAKMFNHPIEFVSPRPGDRSSGLADISSAKNILGYTPRYNLSEYINEQMRKV
jgi:predicted transcriptional regulator